MANKRNDQAHDQEFVDTIKKPHRYNFGNGLFLDVKKSGKYWVFAYKELRSARDRANGSG